MEKKTPEQLRTKYDNLKKDARRYFAKQRQDIYRTGGGVIENVISDILKHIFEKIRAITTLSMEGIEPPVGDSDFCSLSTSETSNFEETSKSVAEAGDDDQHFTQPLDDKMQDVEGIEVVYVEPCVEESVASTPANDWSTYTPTMLRTKKHKLLREKKGDTTNKNALTSSKVLNEITNSKIELNKLKKDLLTQEIREKAELNKEILDTHKLKKENLRLQNELLSLQIKKLKETNSIV
ncbi:hypothetical protein PPYR_03664 [Photinus pyralis]|uniref:Uncharacterized protein n=1 Tax=Photinus pyralis TaxID=7054 RepID=A0A5N4A092_PHOPY|nr:uncharacterized protein LOC116161794 [Photinus pyralis]XP_031359299.1 uncharacterized protein LOC116182879 [Photinus pyralis]KAB0790732.1 hypothetical protein PPYR_15681 [Photinus pyralis]KAB0791864.1 hypothetical protein PPYR_03664 [Photinus pyralis]